MINVAVLGYGTVGSGVVEVIEKNKDMVNKKSAQELEVKYILDLRDFPGDPYENKVIHDFNTILQEAALIRCCCAAASWWKTAGIWVKLQKLWLTALPIRDAPAATASLFPANPMVWDMTS